IAAFLSTPTVAQLTELLEQELGGNERKSIKRRPPGAAPVASIGQQGLWYVQQLEPESPFYSIPLAIRFVGELNIDALQRAMSAIVVRHETLRSILLAGPDGPLVTVQEPKSIPLEVGDLCVEPDALAALERILSEHA